MVTVGAVSKQPSKSARLVQRERIAIRHPAARARLEDKPRNTSGT